MLQGSLCFSDLLPYQNSNGRNRPEEAIYIPVKTINLKRAQNQAEIWKLQNRQKGGQRELHGKYLKNGDVGGSKWFSLCVLLFLLPVSQAKHIEGEIKTAERWAFLARFCFMSEVGTFHFDVEYPLDYAVEKLLLYYDEDSQWPAIYPSDKTCEQRESVLKRENHQFLNLTQNSMQFECEVIRPPDEEGMYHCKGSRSFRSARERWWFIAVSNCDSTKGLQLKYTLKMTNGEDFWYRHFSADEFYILRTNLCALVIQLGLLFLSLLAAVELKNRQLFHTTYRLFMGSLVTQIIGLFFLNMHYFRYGDNGIGYENSKLLGRIHIACSTVIMTLMLLLMGKGFNITRGRLRQMSAVRLTAFMCIFSITYATLFIIEQNMFDPGEVLYIYESIAGYGLICLRCIGWLMFLYACFFTLKHYPEKASFYYPFFVFYTLWFLSGPVVIIISNHVIDKWVREKVVNGVEHSITILGHSFFLFLTRPSAANKNFPYHVRTTQITAMETTTSGVLGNNALDAFSAHTYAPDINPAALVPKNYHTTPDIFLVSGAVEMRPLNSGRPIVKEDCSFPHHPPGAPPP
ncbi:unnamed protein product, partial [Meganyctiphanes norvegica]